MMTKKKTQPTTEDAKAKTETSVETANSNNNNAPKHDFSKELEASKQTILRL